MRAFSTTLAAVIASVALAPVQAAPVKAVPVEPYFLGWPESNTVAGWHARREAVAPIFTVPKLPFLDGYNPDRPFINLRRREPLELPVTIQSVPEFEGTIKARAPFHLTDLGPGPAEAVRYFNEFGEPIHKTRDVAPDTLASWHPIGHCLVLCT
ncbi:hypothetical protein WOLCODRAFT_16625 [Wolfiporia cocos MD-104 SS10]|uniref:Uncharacterized protein n=1 Tax=Wolfiporia cocos (strain MD-104) TaxID=742152 RepID=A0A2H3JLG2_WOLCO|nr:hypothetical protein WOLCODRAFT_16625 [Wolfiporia cocos MD-104 SS10]